MRTKIELVRQALLGALVMALFPVAALAQGGLPVPESIDPPAEVAELRERFQNMTPAEVKAAGYVADPPVCVVVPRLGAMGIHAVNQELMAAQFPKGQMDPHNPPVVLLDANQQQVIGIEWEARDVGQGDMEMFGVPIKLQQGHPGVPDPHYMLHIYFKPGDKVRMLGADPAFDPDITCPAGMPGAGAGGMAGSDALPVWVAAALALAFLAAAGWVYNYRST